MFTVEINEMCSPMSCGVKGFTAKPPAQARLKESVSSYELHLHQKADGPALNHPGFGRVNEGRGKREGDFPI